MFTYNTVISHKNIGSLTKRSLIESVEWFYLPLVEFHHTVVEVFFEIDKTQSITENNTKWLNAEKQRAQ